MLKYFYIILIIASSCSPIPAGKRNWSSDKVERKIERGVEKGMRYNQRCLKRERPLKLKTIKDD